MIRNLVAIAAAAVFVGACAAAPAPPTAQPSVASPASSTAPPVASAAPSPSPSPVAMPAEFLGDWLADVGNLPGLGDAGPRIQLSLDWQNGMTAWVQANPGDRTVLQSASVAPAPGEIRFVTTEPNAGCRIGDDGSYRLSRSPDGLLLTMTSVTDACAARAATFGRTWVRSLGAVNDGRHGVVNYFSPAIEITLPASQFAAGGAQEAADIHTDNGGALIAIKNPSGYTKPCASDGGSRMAIKPTVAAFSTYASHLPGFTVKSSQRTIDGHPAAHLAISTSASVSCAAGAVFEFGPNDLTVTDGGYWSLEPGQRESIWLVDVGKDLYLLQYRGPGVSSNTEEQVLSTVHFVDKLPVP